MVSNQTLSTDIWNDVRTIVVAAAIKQTVGSVVKSASVVASYNDLSPNKPQIVIEPIPYDENLDKFGVVEGKKFINVTIGCYANTSIAVGQLYDQVIYAIKHTDIDGIDLVGYTSDTAFNTASMSKVKLKTITFSYDRE